MEVGADNFNRRILSAINFQALNNEIKTILNRGTDEDNGHKAMLEALEDLIRHNEALNEAFYGQGTAKAMRAAMSGQKDLLMKARQALAKGKGGQS